MSNKYLVNESWKYQQSLYSSFNNELMNGLKNNLTLYNPQKDLTLYKNTDLKPLENINLDDINNSDKSINNDKKKFNFTDLFNSLLMPSPFIGGNLGTDLVNYQNYKIGNDKEFKSITMEYYKPITDLIVNYDKELLTMLGISLIFLIIYKKI
jgi:hypothetical protein